jgi:hypothetical protein
MAAQRSLLDDPSFAGIGTGRAGSKARRDTSSGKVAVLAVLLIGVVVVLLWNAGVFSAGRAAPVAAPPTPEEQAALAAQQKAAADNLKSGRTKVGGE